MLIPITILAGGSVDLANLMRIRSILQDAADASSAASVAIGSPASLAAQSMTSNGTIAVGQTDATNIFNANISSVSSYYTVTFTPTVSKSGLIITSSAQFSVTISNSFMSIVGIPTWTISGTSKAQSNLSAYVDFYMLLDNTPSMGIMATTAYITQMQNATSDQCAFACHDLSNSNNYYNLAKSLSPPVQMRIDVVRTAAQDLTTTATAQETVSNQFRMAMYTFGSKAEADGLTQVAALNSNLATVKTQAAAIDLMTVPSSSYNNDMDTDFDGVLTSINAAITTPGDGSTSSTPQKVLFFVSDGVADAQYPSTCSQPLASSYRCQEPLNTSICTTMKNRGIKIAVLYTTYYPLTTNAWYNTWISPFSSQIATNMQACASPGLYFEVSPSQGISDAMTALFLQALQTVRITQ